MVITDIIYPQNRSAQDDGRDYTALIIWRMNAGARARTRSAWMPPPEPIKVSEPVCLPLTEPRENENQQAPQPSAPKNSVGHGDFPACNLVSVMLGRTLSYYGIMAALDKHFPEHGLTMHQLRSRVQRMCLSPHIQIDRHATPTPEFTLYQVDRAYYLSSENSQKTVTARSN
ncbi:hypothetical protein PMPD1_1723 [Paramixta manurensis]|uniref:Uncharacterized protein n=1 Tax=Paramixta manurensis TaxID=2740817 RepID=A0A6M8UN00_9GAMM|nr:hypothetical protein PMPD1_1723 [Erwiniaceae bacterium PD-1]